VWSPIRREVLISRGRYCGVNQLEASLEDQLIRHWTAQASGTKDPIKGREAALKAWRTIRAKKRLDASKGCVPLLPFLEKTQNLPKGVVSGTYRISPPLIKPSKLTYVENGGVGKQLSDGWVINFAIGCTFGCRFCYVDAIHKKFSFKRAGDIVYNDWGYYFAVPENLEEAMEQTSWEKWKDQEVLMSSTHDPYLPQLYKWTRKILEKALPAGVKLCIQTRSPLVEKDFDLLTKYSELVRLQVSIATMNEELARLIEPRVVSPRRRIEIIRKAKEAGLRVGVIIAPVFPPTKLRPNVKQDLEMIAGELAKIRPDHIYGESLHIRGINLAYVEQALGEMITVERFDKYAGWLFYSSLKAHGLRGIWWPEY
jgi:DNA repair photolyase